MIGTRQLQVTNPTPWMWAVLGGLLGLMLAICIFAPAAWLSYALARASNGHVVLNDAQGSIWGGSAQLVLSGGAGSRDATTLPGRIQWRLRPSLPMGIQTSLKADCCTTQEIKLLVTPHLNGASAVVQATSSTTAL